MKSKIIYLTIILVGLGFFLLKSQDKNQNANQSKQYRATSEEWVPYTSNEFGISLNYPEQWKTAERHDAGNNYIQLVSNIPDSDKGDMFYSFWITTRDNPDNQSFEDLIFPKGTYGDTRSNLYAKTTIGDHTVYKTDNLMSQSGTYHYFLTSDGSRYIDINFFPYYPDHPTINQDKAVDYTNKLSATFKFLTPKGDGTKIITYQQTWIPSGKSVTGSCWDSIATPSNTKAWRCGSKENNNIYDPCFEVGNNKVVCNPDPEKSGSGTTLTFTEPLPSTNDRPIQSHPWMYKLSNNIKCYALTGTADSINGEFYYYGCDNKALMQGDTLKNTIKKDNPLWTTEVVYRDDNFKVIKTEELPILTIWQ